MGKVAELVFDRAAGDDPRESGSSGPVVAEILELPREGVAGIRIGGADPVPARCTLAVWGELSARPWVPGREALVAFEQGDPRRPIVVALMAPLGPAGERIEIEQTPRPDVAQVDGETVVIRGRQRIELRCGKAGIIIREDGKVIVRGTHLLSRSSGAIRLKGGHVDIN